jgi:sugar/nucleoside kinase (ribokinase family)
VSNADAFGRGLLEAVLGPLGVDLGGVKPSDRSAGTVALEFADGANVMLSDAGPLASFGPKDLTDEDWAWVDEADAVLIGNWSQTFAHGTELVEAVLARTSHGSAFTMLDTSDPTHRPEKDARRLVEDPSPLGGLSCWALNEVEAAHFARLATGQQASDLVEAGRAVADAFGGRVDVHSGRHAVTIDQGRVTRVDVDPIQPKRRTGAGDAWNAGSLLGTLLGLGHADRLRVANAVAGCLLTSHDHVPPDLRTLSAWLGRESSAKATAMDK